MPKTKKFPKRIFVVKMTLTELIQQRIKAQRLEAERQQAEKNRLENEQREKETNAARTIFAWLGARHGFTAEDGYMITAHETYPDHDHYDFGIEFESGHVRGTGFVVRDGSVSLVEYEHDRRWHAVHGNTYMDYTDFLDAVVYALSA